MRGGTFPDSVPSTRCGRRLRSVVVQGVDPPAEVLDAVSVAAGAEVTPLSRLIWGPQRRGAARPGGRKGRRRPQSSAPGTPQPPARDVASPESGRARAQERLPHPGLARSGGNSHSRMASDGLRRRGPLTGADPVPPRAADADHRAAGWPSLRALRPLVVRLAPRHRSGTRPRPGAGSDESCRRALGVLHRGLGLGRAPASRVCRRPTTTRGAGHGPHRPQPQQCPGPRRSRGGGRGHRERRQRHAGDRPRQPRVANLPGSAGRCQAAAVDEDPRPGRLGGGRGARGDADSREPRGPHPSRAPRHRPTGGHRGHRAIDELDALR